MQRAWHRPSVRLRILGALSVALAVPAAGRCQAHANPSADHAHAKPSTSLRVVTPEGEKTLSVSEIEALPPTLVTVHNAHSNADEHYSGAKLADVFAKAGAKPGKGSLHSYAIASGTDGYWVLYSGEEISDLVHAGLVIVATRRDSHPLAEDGTLKLISTEDKKPERWVRNLQTVEWEEIRR